MVCSSTICRFNVQIGAGRHLKGFGQASLSGAHRGYKPPQLKTNEAKSWVIHSVAITFKLINCCLPPSSIDYRVKMLDRSFSGLNGVKEKSVYV